MATPPNRERAAAVARWLGLMGVGRPLTGRVVVLSPHLDDAVLSLGAAISHAGRNRSDVVVVTVLAGDPASTEAAGSWDAAAGFGSAGEAAEARRVEDHRACVAVSARPVWLEFSDEQYPRGGDDDAVWAALEPELAGADAVLVPGFPLQHPDHAWLLGLVEERLPLEGRLARYVEQPYAAWTPEEPQGEWKPASASARDRLAKLRACRCYRSQLPLLSRTSPVLPRINRYEAARGGERILT